MAQVRQRQGADVLTIEKDSPLLGLVQAAEQPDHGGLPGTGRTDQRHMLARCNAETEVLDDRLVRAIGEMNVFEHHFPPRRPDELKGLGGGGGLRASGGHGLRLDLEGLLEQLTNALHRRQPTLDLREAFRHLAKRIKQTL